MTDLPDRYPNYPPYDNQVTFYQGSTLRTNPTGALKQAKMCPKCQFPIQIRICLRPCCHYLCYQCYMYNKQECAYCSTVACEVVHLGDQDVLYSCDGECFKVFDSAEMLEKHMGEHGKIRGAAVGRSG